MDIVIGLSHIGYSADKEVRDAYASACTLVHCSGERYASRLTMLLIPCSAFTGSADNAWGVTMYQSVLHLTISTSIMQLAGNVTGIDLIVGGHSHSFLWTTPPPFPVLNTVTNLTDQAFLEV